MKFMDENFLLKNEVSQTLFHKYAKNMPIYDYHCHLNPKEIVENKPFKNITEMWLKGDHYKWRLMRDNGIDEYYITGDADDYEKFEKFVSCVSRAIGNPIYHWCHLELQRYFDCYDILKEENTKKIWDKCAEKTYTPKQLIEMSNVAVICTTDAPGDTLEYHKILKDYKGAKILPAFRPNLNKEFYKDMENPKKWLVEQIEYFHENGCRISDHGLDNFDEFSVDLLKFLAEEYAKKGWTMQLHIGAIRNNNKKMFEKLGPDTGFDSVNDISIAQHVSDILGSVENLPKTILYSLNNIHNSVIGTMTGNFRNVQQGSAWWFNDHYDGMREQMKSLANLGALNKFVGMLTDSRSFLSYPRHEYFRRILCGLIGEWVEEGHFPYDEEILKEIVEGICFNNAVEFFGIEL